MELELSEQAEMQEEVRCRRRWRCRRRSNCGRRWNCLWSASGIATPLQAAEGGGGAVQGGALNRGLFFAGPPPSPLGAVSGKISEIC
jgi:hypothetical protein